MTADTTKTFSLPFLQPGQALKTITHNEALQRLDTGLYMSVSEMAAAELPLEPEDGHTLILSDTPTLDLAAHSGNIAVYRAGDWTWFKPSPGWIIWDSMDQELRVFDGNIWVSGSHQTTADMLPKLGVNTSAQEHHLSFRQIIQDRPNLD